MFGGNGGFGGGYGNNQFSGGIGEMASDYLINRLVPGGLNSMLNKQISFFYLNQF